MADISLSFNAEGGISLDDLVGIFTGTIDPSVSGEVAPLGSIFVRQSGQLYQKVGPQSTDWIRFTQGLGEGVKISATDTTSGYLNSKLLVSSALTKALANSGANETITIDLSNVGTPGTYKSVTVDAKGRITAGTNPTTLTGYGITDAQPLDSTLTALAAFNTAGILVQTAADTFAGRTLTGTTNQIAVANGSGVAGNPTISLPSTLLTFPGTAGFISPIGTTAQRVAVTGYHRFNSQLAREEYYNGTTWIVLDPSTGGTVTSVAITPPASGITLTGSPITTSGTIALSLANDLAGVEGLTTNGFAARTATDTWATRTLTGTSDRLTVVNGDGIAGNPTLDIASTYSGQSSIVTLGTVTTGNWQASTIATQFGGTGRTTIGTANQFLGVNTGGTGLEYKTVQSGSGISIAPATQLLTITNTGVLAITGTANQVIASASTGNITLSLPQNIHSGATPTFASVTVGADPTLPLQLATKQYVDNAVEGLSPKQGVRVGTTANIAFNATVIDGVTLISGNRVLVKNQTIPAENGIYVFDGSTLIRSQDMNSWAEVPAAFVFIEEGTQADTSWVSTANQGGTLDTTPITWVQFYSASDISVSTGLTKTGNTISISNVGTAGSYNNVTTNAQGQVISGSTVAYLTGNQPITLSGDVTGTGTNAIATTLSNTGVAAGTYKSVTVDTKGRVTSGTNPTTLAGYNINDAQPLNAFLTSEAALATSGILIKNGNVALTRSIAVGSTKLSIASADGIAGNPTLDVVESNLALNNIGGTLNVSKGGTGLSSLGTANQIFGVNAGATGAEYKSITGTGVTITHSAGGINFATVNNGTVTSVAVAGSTGLAVTGSPITSSGTINLTLGTELQGLSSLAALGLVTRTAAGTYTSRSVVSGNGTITITNPLGTAGNIGLDLSATGTSGTYRSVTTDIYGRVTSGTNPTTLAGYAITDAINVSQLGANNGVATLDGSGKLSSSQIPASAITDTFVVGSQAAQVALTAEVGDVAVRTDLNKSFILKTVPATSFANWQELLTPTDTVLSVNGQTGIVNVGTVTSVGITPPTAGITASSAITSSGNIVLSLANDLAAVEGLSSTGIAVRTGTDSWATRSLVAGTGVTITNADGVSGNITINSTVGTVTSVAVAAPGLFNITGSPITSSGTITLSLAAVPANTIFAGSAIAGNTAVPSFRTIGLATNDINDVTITSATTNQVLAYNGTRWVNTGAVGANASGLIGVGQAGAAAWTLVSGTTYRADFAHNLSTTNVVITVFDSATNTVVIPDQITLTNTSTVRVQVIGNTRTLKVVVVANGQSIVAGGSTPSSIIVAKDGVTVGTTTTKLNFTGQAVNVTDGGSGTTNVSIGARFSYFANSLDSPNNADFAVNALAPVTVDPTFNSLNVRSFSNTTEQGVGFTCSVPAGATQLTIKFRGRALTAPGAAAVVQPRLYARQIPNGSAVGAWSAANELANIAIPTNAFYQYAVQTLSLSTLGITADRLYQFELTRRIAGVTGTNLAANFLLAEVTLEFA